MKKSLKSFPALIIFAFNFYCGGMVYAKPVTIEFPESSPSKNSNQALFLQYDAYILGPGDGLEIKFFDAPELSGSIDILSDGTASVPLLGSVQLRGLSISQATSWLTALYKKQLLRPNLLLKVTRPRPIRVALIGEVERPGLYSLTTSETVTTEGGPGITTNGLPTLVDAIQKAGGITQLANLKKITLQRRQPGDNPSFKRTNLDLLALLQEGDQLQNPLLFDGDTIKIHKADDIPANATEIAMANFSPKLIQVNVVGQVIKPGTLEVMANTPLVQAIMAAGGPQFGRASTSRIELIRINRNGSATREKFSLNLSQGSSNSKNPPLRNGDTIIVNRNGLAVLSDSIGAVSTPLTGLVNILALTQLLR